ncbi:MAG: hypothetical protein ACTS5I_13235, partial [Rhodanobacter sp.]
FNAVQFSRLKEGFIPQGMDDKWFVYFDAPFLFFHRSWTGQAIYRLELQATAAGAFVVEALISDSYAQAKVDTQDRLQLLEFLISNLLLGQSKPIP